MISFRQLLSVAALGMTMASASALAGDANNASNLSTGLAHAKAVVDGAIAAAGGGGAPQGGGGGPVVWSVDGPELNENDALALPILIQASTTLAQAASNADQSKLAYLSGNIAFGNYRFATACSKMGISRSQIARGNTAALQFPTGFLAAFGPDLAAVVIELNQLRFSEGCP